MIPALKIIRGLQDLLAREMLKLCHLPIFLLIFFSHSRAENAGEVQKEYKCFKMFAFLSGLPRMQFH